MHSEAVIASTGAENFVNLYQRLWKNIGVTSDLNKEKAGDHLLDSMSLKGRSPFVKNIFNVFKIF